MDDLRPDFSKIVNKSSKKHLYSGLKDDQSKIADDLQSCKTKKMSLYTKYAFQTVQEINKTTGPQNWLDTERTEAEQAETPNGGKETERTLNSDVDIEDFYSSIKTDVKPNKRVIIDD